MQKIVVGNWKMYGGPVAQARALAEKVIACGRTTSSVTVVICPSSPLLAVLSPLMSGSKLILGAQDCHGEVEGAYTGDVSAKLLKEIGAAYVIVGHSERRTLHHETSADVRKKAAAAIASGLIPIICVGESAQERKQGKAEEIVAKQVEESLPDAAAKSQFIIAYEPVWAIGSGQTPTAGDIAQMHTHIASAAARRTGLAPERISVLYGGSVKGDNAAAIMATEGVAGVLVGGASLKAEEFCEIIKMTG